MGGCSGLVLRNIHLRTLSPFHSCRAVLNVSIISRAQLLSLGPNFHSLRVPRPRARLPAFTLLKNIHFGPCFEQYASYISYMRKHPWIFHFSSQTCPRRWPMSESPAFVLAKFIYPSVKGSNAEATCRLRLWPPAPDTNGDVM